MKVCFGSIPVLPAALAAWRFLYAKWHSYRRSSSIFASDGEGVETAEQMHGCNQTGFWFSQRVQVQAQAIAT